MPPKAFISYSWSSPAHQTLVQEWAQRLAADGVNVVLDLYELKEGHDKYAFMERMVTDPEVSHVLVLCDKAYAEKADKRKSRVGTESQIISREVYEKVNQSKFIPIICEFDSLGAAFLPAFLKSRIWIDFSSPQAVNENWEKLIRLLFGKPLHQKPKIGTAPSYIREDIAESSNPAIAKFQSLRQAILQEKKGIGLYRRDFLDSCISFADTLRIRERPNTEDLGERVLTDSGKLVLVRNHIVDWVILESEINPWKEFSDALIELLERLRELKSRLTEVNQWSEAWFEAHKLFVYETFLYIVSALLRTHAYEDLHAVFTSHYILPETERYGDRRFDTFDAFYASSEVLNSLLAPSGQRLYSPAAELIKRQAQRSDISFQDVMQADLLTLLMSFINPETRWYPQTLHYSGYSQEFPFFLRATQHRNYKKLATITGFEDVAALRAAVEEGQQRLNVQSWNNFNFRRSFSQAMNLDKLDTVQ